MGYDLHGLEDEDRYERFNIFSWGKVLRLAEQYGWKPEGTTYDQLEDGEVWGGTYRSNDGQIVSVQDANNLADALERAAASIEASALIDEQEIEYWKARIKEFVVFCRAGAFRIY